MDHKLLIAAAVVAALAASPSSARTRHRPFPFVAPTQSSHRFHRGFGSGFADSGYDLQSSYDDLDWGADAGNDWWNDRPDRAFPRWVQHNQDCTPDRMWWSGSGWHC